MYINAIQEDLVSGFDGAGAFLAFRMMTNGAHQGISIGDKIVDEASVEYEVRGKAISNDLTGVHHQYTLVVKQA